LMFNPHFFIRRECGQNIRDLTKKYNEEGVDRMWMKMALELRTKLLTRAEDHAWREQQQTQTPLERAREREALLVNTRLNIPEVLKSD
jgi:hypothetical protein